MLCFRLNKSILLLDFFCLKAPIRILSHYFFSTVLVKKQSVRPVPSSGVSRASNLRGLRVFLRLLGNLMEKLFLTVSTTPRNRMRSMEQTATCSAPLKQVQMNGTFYM